MAIDHSALVAPVAQRATLDATANDVAVLTPAAGATSLLIVADGGSAIKVAVGVSMTDSAPVGDDFVIVAAGASLLIPLESTGSPGQQLIPTIGLASATTSATVGLLYGA